MSDDRSREIALVTLPVTSRSWAEHIPVGSTVIRCSCGDWHDLAFFLAIERETALPEPEPSKGERA